jgi:hypothetical protein
MKVGDYLDLICLTTVRVVDGFMTTPRRWVEYEPALGRLAVNCANCVRVTDFAAVVSAAVA